MCVEPCKLPEGQEVACRYCWQCRANRVNDLCGRCIAEQNSSQAAYAVTLTYAGQGPETAMLRYRDVQLMLKQIRYKGFQVRYIVAGEFGSKKGRAHWHAVLFFSCVGPTGPAPIPRRGVNPWDIRLNERINWKPWPHGFAFFQEPDFGGFQYVLKYVLKDQDADVSKGHLAMSKKPPLGHDYFMARADGYVEQGLAPQDLFYSFSNVFDAKKKRRRFLLRGKSRQNYLDRFIDRWEQVQGTPHPISQELIDHWDKLAGEELANSKTDSEWLAGKHQWPKYARPDAASDASEWARQMYWDDDDKWTVVKGCVPSHLWQDVPDEVVDTFANGESLWLEVLDQPEGLNVYVEAKRQLSWLVNETRAPLWREWVNSLGA